MCAQVVLCQLPRSGWSFGRAAPCQWFNLGISISGLHCINYRVAVGLLVGQLHANGFIYVYLLVAYIVLTTA